MRALIVSLAVAVAAAAGCANDPCSGITSGTCITLRVLPGNNVTTLQTITVDSSLNGGTQMFKQSPDAPTGNTYDLPFDMALVYPPGQSGTVLLAVAAATDDKPTALGDASFTLTSGQHQVVEVMLNVAPGSVTTGDMGTTPANGDMSSLQLTTVVTGSFAGFAASQSVIAAVTASNQTLQIYDYPAGTLKVTLDANVDPHMLYVTDSIVLYCANPTTIGTTTNKSCTLKSWKPGDTSATQLGTGMYPFLPRVSADGTVLGWTENVDATGTKADVVTWFSGTKTTLATQMPLINVAGLIANDVAFAVVPSATAGQFDIVRQSSTASTVHICVNCDQLVIKNDGSQIAARSAPTAGNGKLVVGATSINTMNGLGTSATGSTTSDVTSLIDYFDGGSVMYFSTSGAGYNIREWAESSNTVTSRVSDGSAKGFWQDNGTLLGYFTTLDSNDVGDLWTLTALGGTPTLFDTGGQMYDLTSDGRFTFTKMPTTSNTTWMVEVGGTGAATAPQFKAPSYNGRIVNPTRAAYFTGANSYALVDYTTGNGYSAANVLETNTSLSLKRILFLFSGSANDGIFAYTY